METVTNLFGEEVEVNTELSEKNRAILEAGLNELEEKKEIKPVPKVSEQLFCQLSPQEPLLRYSEDEGFIVNEELVTKDKGIFKRLFGTDKMDLVMGMLYKALDLSPPNMTETKVYNEVIQALEESQPRDEMEAKLKIKEIMLFNQSRYYLKEASRIEGVGNSHRQHWQSFYLKQSSKFFNMHERTVEQLERYKRKGKSMITIQHIKMDGNSKAVIQNT